MAVDTVHGAAGQLNLLAVTALWRNGADANARDEVVGETPLHNAARAAGAEGAAEMVDCLLRSGADETIAGKGGTPPATLVGIDVDEGNDILTEDAKRVRKLLANAPAVRASPRLPSALPCSPRRCAVRTWTEQHTCQHGTEAYHSHKDAKTTAVMRLQWNRGL